MKILIPILGFSNSGGYRVLSKIANELIFLHHEVEFLCPGGSNKPYFPTIAKINWINEKYQIETFRNIHAKAESAISIQQKLFYGLKKTGNNFDVILANHSLTMLPVKRASLLYKTVYYVQAYEADYYAQLPGIKNKILGFFSHQSYNMNVFTIVNADIYHNYKSLRSNRTLYPGVDFKLFYPKAINNKKKENKTIIGSIGRMQHFKGTQVVLDAFKIIRKKYENIELHLAFGDVKIASANPGVYCFHPQGDLALADFYRSLDYYFSAGYYQLGSFHYPVTESMACGIPLVTTPYYPANDLNSWIIKSRDTNDLVKKFEMAFNDPLEREKKIKNGLIDVKQFEWKEVARKMEEYIYEALDLKNK